MLSILVLIVFLVIVFVAILVVGNQLPTSWEIEKAVLVQATPEAIFPYINEPALWEEWSIWDTENFDLSYKGTASGIGASQTWKNAQLQGQMTITRTSAPNQVQYHLDLNQGKFIVSATIVLSITDATFTQVAWRCTARPPKQFQFLLRYQLYFLKNFFDRAMEESLTGLQQIFQPNTDESNSQDNIS